MKQQTCRQEQQRKNMQKNQHNQTEEERALRLLKQQITDNIDIFIRLRDK
ncbi:hypothetical protein [Dolosigranulum savutiense]|uniref:Uncharacterized protein n=1 Tax=Dolosigranulum savutiense TaxID=3110288 RepID=A0AB74U2D3_9LACT